MQIIYVCTLHSPNIPKDIHKIKIKQTNKDKLKKTEAHKKTKGERGGLNRTVNGLQPRRRLIDPNKGLVKKRKKPTEQTTHIKKTQHESERKIQWPQIRLTQR